MDLFLVIIAFIFLAAGLAGAVLPAIPGPPLSFAGIMILGSTSYISFSESFYFITALLALVIVLVDYFVPIYGTRLFGGTKAGMRGSTIGLVLAVIILPLLGITMGPFGLTGLLIGPFLGAYIGEKLAGMDEKKAWRSAIGSFLGFVAGTVLKIVYSLIMIFIALRKLILLWIN